MARFAPTVPVHIAERLQSETGGKDYLGGYHLLLAHDILDKPSSYKVVYGEVRQRYGANAFIILDNSVVELGKAMAIEDLLAAAKIVQPDCIVVPDVMGKGAETRQEAIRFCKQYGQMTTETDDLPPLMGVVQGASLEDAMETCATLTALPMVSYISVPRIITRQQGSRMPLLVEMVRSGSLSVFGGVHLLGFSDNILDDVACARMPIVNGIDSAVPVRAALKGVPMWAGLTEPHHFKEQVGPRGSFWEDAVPAWLSYRKAVWDNLDEYRSWISG